MKPAQFRPTTRTKDRIARWISFLALATLLAMATLPLKPAQHDLAADNTLHWSGSWHG